MPRPRGGPHLHQDLTAQRVLPRAGRLVQLEEERGKEEAGVGRAGGIHGPERELGQEKRGEGCGQGQRQARPVGPLLLAHLPSRPAQSLLREASPGLASALLPPLGARRHRQHSAVSPSHPHLSPRTSGRVTAPNSHTGLGR